VQALESLEADSFKHSAENMYADLIPRALHGRVNTALKESYSGATDAFVRVQLLLKMSELGAAPEAANKRFQLSISWAMSHVEAYVNRARPVAARRLVDDGSGHVRRVGGRVS